MKARTLEHVLFTISPIMMIDLENYHQYCIVHKFVFLLTPSMCGGYQEYLNMFPVLENFVQESLFSLKY